ACRHRRLRVDREQAAQGPRQGRLARHRGRHQRRPRAAARRVLPQGRRDRGLARGHGARRRRPGRRRDDERHARARDARRGEPRQARARREARGPKRSGTGARRGRGPGGVRATRHRREGRLQPPLPPGAAQDRKSVV
ncbi:MAG: Myo-inositol 2-dehydrogenase 1, partial [uncultured Phycisphaerae bacterium]